MRMTHYVTSKVRGASNRDLDLDPSDLMIPWLHTSLPTNSHLDISSAIFAQLTLVPNIHTVTQKELECVKYSSNCTALIGDFLKPRYVIYSSVFNLISYTYAVTYEKLRHSQFCLAKSS